LTPEGIIKLTLGKDVPPDLLANPEWSRPLENGERLDVESNGNEINCLCRSWMSAEARMALFIPLHPDRMTLEDWTALSGIGPRLALRIEQHRQKYGDFKSLGTLQNVPGIGPKRISSWKVFF
jgi:competence protein ComEA